MQNSTRHLKNQKTRLNPSEHRELVKISRDRAIEIEVAKTGSIETRIFDFENRKIKRYGERSVPHI